MNCSRVTFRIRRMLEGKLNPILSLGDDDEAAGK